jgi:hypothetical protein
VKAGGSGMVVADKIFRLSDALPLVEVASRLHGYCSEEYHEEGELKLALISGVAGLLPKKNMLNGICSHDYVIQVFHRGRIPRFRERLKRCSALLNMETPCS